MRLPIVSFAAVFLNVSFSGSAVAQPSINTKNFSVDCRPLRGDTERGLGGTKQRNSGVTIVAQRFVPGLLQRTCEPGFEILGGRWGRRAPNPRPRLVAAFATKQQKVQLYGGLQPNAVYTIFITYRGGRGQDASARTVIKARRCMPYVEPGIIPNELRHDRPLHLG